MVIKAWVWVLLLFIATGLTGCRPDPNVQFIQGSWYYLDPHLQSVAGESQLETVWAFDRGTYTTYSCCFVKSQANGWYQLIESEADALVIELSNRDGDPNTERYLVRIEIDREADTIEIQGTGPFERTGP